MAAFGNSDRRGTMVTERGSYGDDRVAEWCVRGPAC